MVKKQKKQKLYFNSKLSLISALTHKTRTGYSGTRKSRSRIKSRLKKSEDATTEKSNMGNDGNNRYE